MVGDWVPCPGTMKPTLYKERHDDGRVLYRGSDYQVLQTLAKSLNFKTRIRQRRYCMRFARPATGGMCKALQLKKVDILAFCIGSQYRFIRKPISTDR